MVAKNISILRLAVRSRSRAHTHTHTQTCRHTRLRSYRYRAVCRQVRWFSGPRPRISEMPNKFGKFDELLAHAHTHVVVQHRAVHTQHELIAKFAFVLMLGPLGQCTTLSQTTSIFDLQTSNRECAIRAHTHRHTHTHRMYMI